MELHERYAVAQREDGQVWLYAADVGVLAELAENPRPLGRFVDASGAGRSLTGVVPSLLAVDEDWRSIRRSGLPVLVVLAFAGDVENVYHSSRPWPVLRRSLGVHQRRVQCDPRRILAGQCRSRKRR